MYRTDEEASDEIVGYLTIPLPSPGFNGDYINSADYPRLPLNLWKTHNAKVAPIAVLVDEAEILELIQFMKFNQ